MCCVPVHNMFTWLSFSPSGVSHPPGGQVLSLHASGPAGSQPDQGQESHRTQLCMLRAQRPLRLCPNLRGGVLCESLTTHTHTHTQTHKDTHKQTDKQTPTHTNRHTKTDTYTHTHLRSLITSSPPRSTSLYPRGNRKRCIHPLSAEYAGRVGQVARALQHPSAGGQGQTVWLCVPPGPQVRHRHSLCRTQPACTRTPTVKHWDST